MNGNLGKTKLKKRRRREDPMKEFDMLPPLLRSWLANAALPWRPRSVRRAYVRALSRTGNAQGALQELDRLQAKQLAKEESRYGCPGNA